MLREVGEEVEVREEVGTSELDQSFSVVSAVSEALLCVIICNRLHVLNDFCDVNVTARH